MIELFSWPNLACMWTFVNKCSRMSNADPCIVANFIHIYIPIIVFNHHASRRLCTNLKKFKNLIIWTSSYEDYCSTKNINLRAMRFNRYNRNTDVRYCTCLGLQTRHLCNCNLSNRYASSKLHLLCERLYVKQTYTGVARLVIASDKFRVSHTLVIILVAYVVPRFVIEYNSSPRRFQHLSLSTVRCLAVVGCNVTIISTRKMQSSLNNLADVHITWSRCKISR